MFSIASWIDETFAGFDGSVFNAFHDLAVSMGGILTPLTKIFSLACEKGIIFFVISLILMLFPKTRKGGVCMFGALCFGAIVTGLILKDGIARVRPYDASAEYRAFWEYVGGKESSSYCFPSGHTTMVTAAVFAFFIFFNKKWSWTGLLLVPMIGFARVYLVAHYITDVIGGIIVGIVAAILSLIVTKIIWVVLEKNKDKKFFAFCLDFDIRKAFGKSKSEETDDSEKTE